MYCLIYPNLQKIFSSKAAFYVLTILDKDILYITHAVASWNEALCKNLTESSDCRTFSVVLSRPFSTDGHMASVTCFFFFVMILSCIHGLWNCHQPTQRPAPSWPKSSTGRTLHSHRRDQGSNSSSCLIFSGLSPYCLNRAKNCEDYAHLF